MNLILISLFTFNHIGIISSILMSIMHSLISSGLFYIVTYLYYNYKIRIYYYFNSIDYLYLFKLLFLYLFLSNVSFPLTSSFIPEIMIINSIINKFNLLTIPVLIIIFLSSIYGFYKYTLIIYGKDKLNIKYYVDLTIIHYLNIFYINLPNILFALNNNILNNIILSTICYNLI